MAKNVGETTGDDYDGLVNNVYQDKGSIARARAHLSQLYKDDAKKLELSMGALERLRKSIHKESIMRGSPISKSKKALPT